MFVFIGVLYYLLESPVDLSIIAACFAAVYVFSIYYYYYHKHPQQVKNDFVKYTNLQKGVSFSIHDDGLEMCTPNDHEVLQWKDIISWKQSDLCLVLFKSQKSWRVLPRRMSQDGLFFEKLEQKLLSNVGNPA